MNFKEENKKIEGKVVGLYKKIESTVTKNYQKIEDDFVEKYLKRIMNQLKKQKNV